MKQLYELTTDLTSSPLQWGIRCAASQADASCCETTQNPPSRRMTLALKVLLRGVCAVDVIRSFKPSWSTKAQSSEGR